MSAQRAPGELRRTYWKKAGTEGGRAECKLEDPYCILVSSMLWQGTGDTSETTHAPALDIDVPAYLVPSSTPGHSHLYIDHPMSWDQYECLIDALAFAGIIEDGYARASKYRGQTFLRCPGIVKGAAEMPEAGYDATIVPWLQ